jgi:undecaprenyl diphosphate synthase
LVRDQMLHLVDITKNNKRGNLILALSYGSQNEILNAVKKISSEVKNGELEIEDIDEKVFENHLYTKDIPPVDLLVRTSGEVRISNFLLWQIAYAELQFLDILWPDFGKEDFFRCIYDYQNKERRFGKTSEQLDQKL